MSVIAIPVKATCPSCEYVMDQSSEIQGGDERPEPGDVGVCIQCAAALIYAMNDDGLTLGLRFPTKKEKVELSTHPELAELQAAVKAAKGVWE